MDNSPPVNSSNSSLTGAPAGEMTSANPAHAAHQPPPRRRVFLPIVLFLATCLSTFWVGAITFHDRGRVNYEQGFLYTGCVMGILLAHEMGHFLMTLRYRIPASLPFFIPMPFSPIGTMGAVIGMHAYLANRKQLFDIGLAGPILGLVLAVPITWYGITQADPVPEAYLDQGILTYQDPVLMEWMIRYLRPEVPTAELILNPYLLAGWVGFLVTGLNMFPISQLDGGHISYALLGTGAHILARLVVIAALIFMALSHVYMLAPMLILLFLLGIKHPPTADDKVDLGWPRQVLGFASLLIPVLCFPPWVIHY